MAGVEAVVRIRVAPNFHAILWWVTSHFLGVERVEAVMASRESPPVNEKVFQNIWLRKKS